MAAWWTGIVLTLALSVIEIIVLRLGLVMYRLSYRFLNIQQPCFTTINALSKVCYLPSKRSAIDAFIFYDHAETSTKNSDR